MRLTALMVLIFLMIICISCMVWGIYHTFGDEGDAYGEGEKEEDSTVLQNIKG